MNENTTNTFETENTTENKTAEVKAKPGKLRTLYSIITTIILFFLLLLYDGSNSQRIKRLEEAIAAESTTNEQELVMSDTATTTASPYQVIPMDSSIYNNASFSDMTYCEETDDEAISRIISIHLTEYGTAGSSLKQAISAYDFLMLSKMSEQQLSSISAHLDKMTALQRDFLSYQLNKAYELSLNILDNDDYLSGLFDEMNIKEETYSDITKEDLRAFWDYISTLLKEKGVTDEWKKVDMSSVLN